MRLKQAKQARAVLALAGVAAITIASIAPAPAAVAGTGGSGGSAEVLHLALGGGALDLRVLTESSSTSNDPVAGTPEALERLAPLTVASSLLPALDGVTIPAIESRSTGPENSVDAPAVDLGTLSPLPNLLDGTIGPGTLRSLVDANGALAALGADASGVTVLGGLLRLGELDAGLGSSALTETANGSRALTLDTVEVLDLDALLQALGLNLADLPLDVAAGLLEQLGLALPGGLPSADAVVDTVLGGIDDIRAQVGAQIDTLNGQLDDAQADLAVALGARVAALPGHQAALSAAQAQVVAIDQQIAALTAQLGGVCPLPLDPLNLCGQITALQATRAAFVADVAAAQSAIDVLNAAVDAAQAVVNQVLDLINDLLDSILDLVRPILDIIDGVLDGLAGASLLTVEDLEVGTLADARDTVAGSAASVAGSVGAIRIGGIQLPGVDALATVDQVTALADDITGTLGGILGTIDPSLASLVDVDLLDRSSLVNGPDGAVRAEALITGLRVTVTPPDLCALLGGLPTADTLGGLLGSLGQALPPLPTAQVTQVLGDLGSILDCVTGGALVRAQLTGGIVPALTQPLTVEALTMRSAGAFTPAGAQVTTTTTSTSTTTTAPTSGTPSGGSPTGAPLPRTGGDLVLATAGLLMLGTALALRKLATKAA